MSPSMRWVVAIVALAVSADSFQVSADPEAGLSADYSSQLAEWKLNLAKARLRTLKTAIKWTQPAEAEDSDNSVLLQSPSDFSSPMEQAETVLVQTEAPSTSSDLTFFQQLSQDIQSEGVFHYFVSRAAFWIGVSSACMVMCLLQLACCTPYADEGEFALEDDDAEA
ncbi:unnamed protein product [Symbiodinium sp. CCMP2456]|nr:unnamed protein product [Symbiodinium sp. CCMP2456]